MPTQPTRWTNELLDRMRQQTDPEAEAVIAEIFNQGNVEAINKLLIPLIENDQNIPDDLPPIVKDYLNRKSSLPTWADQRKIQIAQELFADQGMLICLSLICASLPECYANANGVHALCMTARLTNDTQRRVAETAQMVMDVNAVGGLDPNGNGIRTIQKVRLMHATIRHFLSSSPEWKPEWGKPINQEDLAMTLMAFSYRIIECLKKFDINVTDEQAEAYLHLWKVVGHLMGLCDELLPQNYAEAEALMAAVHQRQFKASDDGREITAALIKLMEYQIPGNFFDGFPSALLRYLLGDEMGDLLGVPQPDWTTKLVGPFRELCDLQEEEVAESVVMRKVVQVYSREFLEGLIWLERGGKRAPFSIPTALRENWKLQTAPLDFQKLQNSFFAIFRHGLSRIVTFISGIAVSMLVAPVVALFFIFFWITSPLMNDVAPCGMLSLEFAGTAERAQAILNSWDSQNQIRAGFSVGYSFILLTLFPLTIGLACLWVAKALRNLPRTLSNLGTRLAWAQLLAVMLWLVQSILLMFLLFGIGFSLSAEVILLLTIGKYILVIAGLLYAVLGGLNFIGRAKTHARTVTQ